MVARQSTRAKPWRRALPPQPMQSTTPGRSGSGRAIRSTSTWRPTRPAPAPRRRCSRFCRAGRRNCTATATSQGCTAARPPASAIWLRNTARATRSRTRSGLPTGTASRRPAPLISRAGIGATTSVCTSSAAASTPPTAGSRSTSTATTWMAPRRARARRLEPRPRLPPILRHRRSPAIRVSDRRWPRATGPGPTIRPRTATSGRTATAPGRVARRSEERRPCVTR